MLKRSAALALALLLVGLSGLAAALALADVYRVEGAQLVDEWSTAEELSVPPPWAWEQAQRYLWVASRLAPLDPDIQNDLGRLFELRVTEERAGEPQAQADLTQALEHYRASLGLRPAWPYVWTNVFMVKVKQEVLDGELALAMARTAALGPWETMLQTALAGTGLSLWKQLPADLQALIEHTLARGLANGSGEMLRMAELHGLVQPDLLETP